MIDEGETARSEKSISVLGGQRDDEAPAKPARSGWHKACQSSVSRGARKSARASGQQNHNLGRTFSQRGPQGLEAPASREARARAAAPRLHIMPEAAAGDESDRRARAGFVSPCARAQPKVPGLGRTTEATVRPCAPARFTCSLLRCCARERRA